MDEQSKVTLFMVLGSVAMVVMFIAIATATYFYQKKILRNKLESENKLQREVFAAAIAAEERQKELIANNLHDTINPNLALVKNIIQLQNKERIKVDNPDSFINCEEIVDECMRGIREACYDLKPQSLHNLGLTKAIEHIMFNIDSSGAAHCTFNFTDVGKNGESKMLIQQTNIYRIVQELLNNVLKHAKPSFINLDASHLSDFFKVTIEYDGMSMDTAALPLLKKKGLGLSSIESRRIVLNAEIDYNQSAGINAIVLRVPVS